MATTRSTAPARGLYLQTTTATAKPSVAWSLGNEVSSDGGINWWTGWLRYGRGLGKALPINWPRPNASSAEIPARSAAHWFFGRQEIQRTMSASAKTIGRYFAHPTMTASSAALRPGSPLTARNKE